MDQEAYNYDELANVESNMCLYDAECITGPGNPYWLNDECYEWVIDVDNYCCEEEWDNVCQLTYDYCNGTWTGPLPRREIEKELIYITDVLGRTSNIVKNQLLFYIYSDGSVERKILKK